MARHPVVERTFKHAVVTCAVIDISDMTASTVVVELAKSKFKDEAEVLKCTQKVLNDQTHKVVKIISVDFKVNLYRMDADVFIANAECLPPRESDKVEEI